MAILPRLEAAGDAVWFQGELYRAKMRHDLPQMLHTVAEQRKREAGAAHAVVADPFAPKGREAVLPTKTAATPDGAPLRVAEQQSDGERIRPLQWTTAKHGTPVRAVEPRFLVGGGTPGRARK